LQKSTTRGRTTSCRPSTRRVTQLNTCAPSMTSFDFHACYVSRRGRTDGRRSSRGGSIAYAEQDQRRDFDQVAAAQFTRWRGTGAIATSARGAVASGRSAHPRSEEGSVVSRAVQRERAAVRAGRIMAGTTRGRGGTSLRPYVHQRRISKTRWNGVSAACRKWVKPAF